MTPKSVCYVLKSFPQPSETFIADEGVSLLEGGVQVSIAFSLQGESRVVHPSARQLIDDGRVRAIGRPSRRQALYGMLALFVRAPLRTLRTARRIWTTPERWHYASMLPVAAWCQARGVDFVHAHFADHNLALALALADWLNVPCGVTTHRYDILDDPVPRQLLAAQLHRCDLRVTISKWNQVFMAERFHIPMQQIEVVHCGVDLRRFPFRPVSLNTGDCIRLLNVGRLVEAKAQDDLLRALAIARSAGVDCTLDIVGAGPLEAVLSQLCSDLGLSEHVRFHGAQPQEAVQKLFAQAHAFVLPSRAEGLPVVCMEAAASGTPIIASRIFGIPELLEDGHSGFLVPPDDPQQLAQAIIRLSSMRQDLPAIAARARQRVEDGFNRTRCTKELIAAMSAATVGKHRSDRRRF